MRSFIYLPRTTQTTAAGVRKRWNSNRVTTWPTTQSRHLRAVPSEGRGAMIGWKGRPASSEATSSGRLKRN